jgi:hypothetical protein
MNTLKLREAIVADRAAGLLTFMVVGTRSLTNTGGIDPLNEIADIAQSENLWFHVDGASGASVLLSKQHRHLAHGIARADSLSWTATNGSSRRLAAASCFFWMYGICTTRLSRKGCICETQMNMMKKSISSIGGLS